jgi:uncharacterized protein
LVKDQFLFGSLGWGEHNVFDEIGHRVPPRRWIKKQDACLLQDTTFGHTFLRLFQRRSILQRIFDEFILNADLSQPPDDVTIETEEKEHKTVFKLKAAEGDIGKIIGKEGKTASALRVLPRRCVCCFVPLVPKKAGKLS